MWEVKYHREKVVLLASSFTEHVSPGQNEILWKIIFKKIKNIIKIVEHFLLFTIFFKGIIKIVSAVFVFSGEEIIVCNYSPTGFARFAFGC